MQVHLTPQEKRTLLALVENRLLEYYTEIRHTRTYEYKELLKRNKRELEAVRNLLKKARSPRLELNDAISSRLIEVLQCLLHELPGEIRHTDRRHVRESLKDERIRIRRILHRLQIQIY